MKRYLLLILLVVCVSCDVAFNVPQDEHCYLSCENNSNNTVYLSLFFPDPPKEHCPFSLPEKCCAVAPRTINDCIIPLSRGDTYENIFRKYSTIVVYVFPFYTEKSILLDDNKLVSYILTLEDLVSLNFHLSYPPNKDMKDVRMDPAYGKIDSPSSNGR